MFSKAGRFFDKSLLEVNRPDFNLNETGPPILQCHFGINAPFLIFTVFQKALKISKIAVARYYLYPFKQIKCCMITMTISEWPLLRRSVI
jgi:hypothetical protein